jgi:hypothetical protein
MFLIHPCCLDKRGTGRKEDVERGDRTHSAFPRSYAAPPRLKRSMRIAMNNRVLDWFIVALQQNQARLGGEVVDSEAELQSQE